MRLVTPFLLSAVLAVGAANVDRRQISNIPGLPVPMCALYCVTSTTNGGPANCADNAACICADSTFGQEIASCISSNCNATDIGPAVQFAQEYCYSAGVTKVSIPLSYTIFPSTSTSTPAASSSSTVAASTSNAGGLSLAPSASVSGSGSASASGSGSAPSSASATNSGSASASGSSGSAMSSVSASTSNGGALSLVPSASGSGSATSTSASSSAPPAATGLPIPQCALFCVTSVTNAGKASCADNAACLCPDPAFVQSLSSCVYSNCNASDVAASLEFAKEYCYSAGVTISLSIPSASASATAAYLAAVNGTSTATASAAPSSSGAKGIEALSSTLLIGLLAALTCITVF